MSDTHTIEVVTGEETTVKIVRALKHDANRKIVEAAMRDARTPVEIVARHLPDGAWEPLYALKRGEPMPLKHCFRLNEAAILALDAARDKEPSSSADSTSGLVT